MLSVSGEKEGGLPTTMPHVYYAVDETHTEISLLLIVFSGSLCDLPPV